MRSAAASRASLALLAVAYRGAGCAAQPIRPAPAFKGDALVAAPTANWPTNGGNWYNQRYSPLTEIDRSNVANLKGVWRTRLARLRHRHEVFGRSAADRLRRRRLRRHGRRRRVRDRRRQRRDPVVVRGESRRKRTTSSAAAGRAAASASATARCSSASSTASSSRSIRKPAASRGRCKPSAGRTGSRSRARRSTTTGSSSRASPAPSTASAAASKRSTRASGKLVWTFYTIPGPGEFGHDTWPQDNDLWMHGGASVWQTPAVDPELGLIFFSTGNPGPDYNGGVRAGDNLFSASIVALDAKTGEYRWHFQQVHHDIWDYDGPSPVVLFDLELNGAQRKGIAQPSKTGWVYILDRTNGTPLIGIDERPVPQEPRQATAATQPYPRGDAFVPQSIAVAPEGFTLVNGGKIFTPFWTDARGADQAVVRRRRELAAELVRSGERLSICLRAGSRRRLQGRSAVRANGRRPASATSPGCSARRACRTSACSRRSTCTRTRSSGSSSGPTRATAARRRPPAGSRSSAATTAGSRRSTRATARSSGNSKPAPA